MEMMTKLRSSADLRGTVLALALVASACGSESADPPTTSQDPSLTAGTSSIGLPTAGSQAPVNGSSAGRGAAGSGSAGRGAAGSGSGGAGQGPAGASAAGAAAAGSGAAGTSAAGTGAAGSGTAGAGPVVMEPVPGELPVCEDKSPAEFEVNASVGGGGSSFKDSPHFRIYGVSDAQATAAIGELEAAYTCFVEKLCWRSSGLSYKDASDAGPYYKMNIYGVGSLGGAGGQMFSEAGPGLSYLKVVTSYLTDPKVTVHEYGHALTYHEKNWVDQKNTGAWWETVANFVADTYMTSPLCADARSKHGQTEGKTVIDLNKVIGDSFQVIVDASQGSGNYYQAWPLLAYLTNNPDGYAGLGATALRDMFRKHMRNNETPLHVLQRIAAPVTVQKILGRYWARMAYVDIGHKQAQAAFMSGRSRLNFANLDSTGAGAYKVKANRQPRYFGSNIIPLTAMGEVTAKVTSSAPFTATLAVRASSGAVRYVDLENGTATTTVAAGEEASLVVVNTPAALAMYDPFAISGEVARGLDYQVQLTGATAAN